jgi:UDP-glucose 4-epimerase
MKAIWITGAHGFIGHHVVQHLSKQGCLVIGVGHGAWIKHEYEAWGLTGWLNGDISFANLDVLAKQFGEPDGIIHLAGGSSVGSSLTSPAEDFRRTVIGTADLVEWVRLHAPRASLVMSSSAAVYGSHNAQLLKETMPCNPFSPYGYHKRMAELSLESYALNFGLNIANVRLFSIYGVGLKKQLLWDCCTKLAQGKGLLTLGGNGDELRDWLHVHDAVSLLFSALNYANTDAPVINGGTGIAIPVREIAEHLIKCWGGEQMLYFSGLARHGDPQSLVADVTLSKSWNWDPKFDWKVGLAEYVAWFKDLHFRSVN